jgi:hypothetical protein
MGERRRQYLERLGRAISSRTERPGCARALRLAPCPGNPTSGLSDPERFASIGNLTVVVEQTFRGLIACSADPISIHKLGPNWAPRGPRRTPWGTKKPRRSRAFSYSGGGIRTRDLRVMSPTSYQTAPPRVASHVLAKIWRAPRAAQRRSQERASSRLAGTPGIPATRHRTAARATRHSRPRPIYHPAPCTQRSWTSAPTQRAC